MVLQDICEFIVDCPHSTAPDEGMGYPLIRTPNIGKGRLKLEGVQRVSKEVYDKRNKRAVPQVDDIIFAREAPAGNAAIICEGQEVCLGQRTVLIRPDKEKVYPKFLVYYILAPQQQYELLGTANGATVAHVNIPIIKNLPIELPSLEQQIRIADIVFTYDDLIANNQRQIKLLEEAAQRLYKEWFVDLRFPGYEDVAIVDGVPEGWKKDIFVNIAILKAGGDRPKTFSKERNNICSVPVYSNGTENEGLYGYTDIPVIEDECITISARGSVGYICLRRVPFVPIVRLISVVPKEIDVIYLYLYLKNFKFDSNGAAQQQITVPMIKDKEILLPSEKIINEFIKQIYPVQDKIDNLKKQIERITEARDRLLPKLMSGE